MAGKILVRNILMSLGKIWMPKDNGASSKHRKATVDGSCARTALPDPTSRGTALASNAS